MQKKQLMCIFYFEILTKTKGMTRGKVLDMTDGGLCGYRFDKMIKTG